MAAPSVPENILPRNGRPLSHGESYGAGLTPEYTAWQHMKDRCHNPNNQDAKDYSERGIEVCEEWRASYEAFLAYVGRRPSPKHTLERIDVNGNYEPGNVEWATWKKQQNNRRNNVLLIHAGKTMTLAQWAEEIGVPYSRLHKRVFKLGLPLEQALRKKLEHRRCEHLVTYDGQTLSLTDWAVETKLPYNTIKGRLRNGWPVERALTEPVAAEKSHPSRHSSGITWDQCHSRGRR